MDLEDTYRSNEDEIAYQIDPIQNISSKKWLNSAGASLANLNQIQASVYNIGLVDAKNLRAPSSLSREKRSGSYGDISATPPLSTVSLQQTCNTWGSNNSIPDLIKQHVQSDGTKLQRPESAKYNSVRRQRPSSGKKTRPQSATTQESQLPPKPPGIAVKGSKCDPAGRPPKYSPQQSVTTGWVGPPAGMKFPDNPAQDLSRILTSEPPSPPPPPQGTPAPPTGTSGPPPAPRSSPIPIPFGDDNEDESIHENSVPELRYTKGNPYVSPVLLRKPTPEPIHLSLPTMEDEEADEEEQDGDMNTDRLLELAEEKSSQLTQANSQSTNSDNPDMFKGKSNSAGHHSEHQHNHVIHSSVEEDHMFIESDGDWSVDEEVADQPHPLSKSTVTFCEDNNVTIDITPRNLGYKVNDGPNQTKPKKPVIPNETKELQLDLNSLLMVTGTESAGENKESKSEVTDNTSSTTGISDNKKNAYRNLQKSSAQKLRASSASKHYSSRYASHMEKCEKIYGMNNRTFSSFKPPKNRPVTPVTTVMVDYGEKEEAEKKVRKKRKEKDIVTLVQQVSMSDSDEDKGDNSNEIEDVELTADLLQPWAPTKQVSGPVKNYYELSRQKTTQPTQPTPQPKDERNDQPHVYKTTKTIEFDDEMPKETNIKSVIQPVVQNVKEKSNENLKKPPSRPTSAKVTKRPPVSGACANDQDRPGSRLGFVSMSPEKEASKSEEETQSNTKKALKRPVSASTNHKRPVSATSNLKMPGSSHSKEKLQPDRVSSPSPLAAEPSEKNVTEIKQVEIKDPREIEIDRLIQKHLKRPPTTFKPTIDVFASDLVSDSEDPDSNTTAMNSNLTAGKTSPKSNHDVTTVSPQYHHDVTTVSDHTSHDVTSTLSPKPSATKSTTAKIKSSTKAKEVSNITLHLDDKVKTLVSDSCAGHKHYASYSRCRSAPIQRKNAQIKERIRYTKPYYINTLKQHEDDLDTEEGTECALLQAKLAATGINVKAETLQRALYPPAGNSRYYEISAYLPKSQSLGLLSHPKVWLPVEYKQLKLAEKNLEKVNEIMRRQKLQEAKEARLAELAARGESGTKKKKGKKGKGKKKVKTRRNSVS